MTTDDRFGRIDIIAARVFARVGRFPDWYAELLAHAQRDPSPEVIDEAETMRARFLAGDPMWRNGTVRVSAASPVSACAVI